MKRRLQSIAVTGAVGGTLLGAAPASAQEPVFEPHPHMLVLGVEFDEAGNPIGFRKCVDLAANQALPIKAQHQHVHFATAADQLLTHAGHLVVPGAPFPAPFEEPLPWSNCEELIDFFFPENG